MQIEAISVPKYRDGRTVGDDVMLMVPGCLFAVFDGATDARGTVVDGVPAGRFAALTVARAIAVATVSDADRMQPAGAIFEAASQALRAQTKGKGFAIPPSTTLALALDCGANWRFLILGDSGIRLNGTELFQPTKLIDTVSTMARITVFAHFQQSGTMLSPDATEAATRRAIFLGLDQCIAEGKVPAALAADIIADVTHSCGLAANAATVEAFLRGGICMQHSYANTPGSIFGFDTMNGTEPCLGQWIDETRPKSAIHSIELFTDGYPAPPRDVSLSAWQDAFTEMEHQDPHMTGPYAAVKGATSTEHHDDRTVIVLTNLTG